MANCLDFICMHRVCTVIEKKVQGCDFSTPASPIDNDPHLSEDIDYGGFKLEFV